MAVDAAVTTSAEAARYRAAGWWTDATLSDCVRRNAASTPGRTAYVDFTLEPPDQALTWSEFDNAATNLAVQLQRLGVVPGDRVAIWHSDSIAIHVLLVAIERCGAVSVGLGARAGVREAAQILRTARPVLMVSDADRYASAAQAAAEAGSLAVVALGVDLVVDTRCPTDSVALSPVG